MPLFGNLFDLDGDGKLSDFDQAVELGFFAQMMEELSQDTSDD